MLQLRFEKGRVLMRKKGIFSTPCHAKRALLSLPQDVETHVKIEFGIYTANTAACFVTTALKLRKTVTFIVFVHFFYDLFTNFTKL